MTVDDVNEVVERIRQTSSDPEVAHAMEDSLWMKVLGEISKTNKQLSGNLAYTALKTKDIDFPRRCV